MKNSRPKLLGSDEVAKILGVCRQYINQLVKEKKLNCVIISALVHKKTGL